MTVPVPAVPASPRRRAWRRFAAGGLAPLGLVVLAAMVSGGIAAALGDDSGVIGAVAATPATLALAVLAAALGSAAGVVWGAFAASAGPATERRCMDAARRLTTLPLPLAVVLAVGAFGHRLPVLVGAVALVVMPMVAGGAHAAVRALSRRELRTGLHASGITGRTMLCRHVLPNLAGPLAAAAWPALGRALMAESLASFVGLGAPEGLGTWGSRMGAAAAAGDLAGLVVPLALFAVALAALAAIGDGLRAAAGEAGR